MTDKKIPYFIAKAPILFLIVLLSINVVMYNDPIGGSNQLALLLSGALAAVIGLYYGSKWKDIIEGISKSVKSVVPAIIMLLLIGSLSGTWLISGVIPTMIYYGLQILNPKIFLFATAIITAIVSLATGSSWSTIATVGIALLGIGTAIGLPLGLIGGAIISGAYFGDKMSPLSDTTNLAPAVAGTDLFTHINHMIWTTGPSLIITLIIFLFMGINAPDVQNVAGLELIQNTINNNFNISLISFFPLIMVFVLAFKKMPAFPTVLIGALIGGVFAILFQPDVVEKFVGETYLPSFLIKISGVWTALHSGYAIDTGVPVVDDLLSRGGMSSMLNTIWLVITALTFGAVLETTKLLNTIVTVLLSFVKSTSSLIITTIATCIGINIVTADQYIAIVLPGRMFKTEFKKRKLAPKNLSRTLEDSATMTSPLVPWNTCGAFMSASLGIATFSYLPFCFFNLINPVIAIIYALFNFKIEKI